MDLPKNDRKYRVTFLPQKRTVSVLAGSTVLDAARQLGLPIQNICGGVGICGKCKVLIKRGVSVATLEDKELIPANELQAGYRLACRARIDQDCEVFVPEIQAEEAATILTAGERKRTKIAPGIEKKFIHLARPKLEENLDDLGAVLQAAEMDEKTTKPTLNFLQQLPFALRRSHYSGTLVRLHDRIISFEENDTTGARFGIAVDLGTTTVVAKLIDLSDGIVLETVSRVNDQRAFGEDVISRITYLSTHKQGLGVLQKTVIDLLNDMIKELSRKTRVLPGHIYEMTVAGNTVMEHLLLGIDPRYLAEMPYVPVFKAPQNIVAREIGVGIHPDGNIYLLPIIGRYVGGDTSALLLSLSSRFDATWIAVDIGTNGEIALCHNGKIYACSTAAGPAFEGAHIKCGMRATVGAIDRVFWERDDLRIHVIGEAEARGICGSGLIDAIGSFLQAGLINKTGRIVSGGDGDNVDNALARFIVEDSGNRSVLLPDSNVVITQRDIREIQLAKGAIASGIDILLNRAGIRASDLDAVYLAGAFGQYIRREMAVAIGLLPAVDKEKIHFIGNAACTGAELALISVQERSMIEALVKSMEYVEISTDPQFQDLFAENMLFP